MSMYAVVLEKLRGDTEGKTISQLAVSLDVPETAVSDALVMLVLDGRVTDTEGTYTIKSGRADK